MSKKIIVGVYKDEETGITFVEDDRGNYHCVYMSPGQQTTEIQPIDISYLKRLERVMHALRRENNWLWESIEVALSERKKSCSTAMNNLERKIKERRRL